MGSVCAPEQPNRLRPLYSVLSCSGWLGELALLLRLVNENERDKQLHFPSKCISSMQFDFGSMFAMTRQHVNSVNWTKVENSLRK